MSRIATTTFFIVFVSWSAFASDEMADRGAVDAKESAQLEEAQKGAASCSEISDKLCDRLFNKKNRGTLKVFDGRLERGNSKKSETSMAKLADLRALVDSESKLPADIRKALAPRLKALRSQLKNESNRDTWHLGLYEIEQGIKIDLAKVRNERTYARFPEVRTKASEKLTLEEKEALNNSELQVEKDILEAKYKDHPNWKRVGETFREAQQDIIASIEAMDLPEAKKKFMLERVRTAKLTLPYSDPKLMGMKDDCGTTQSNAVYRADHHAFTMCAGMFNSTQSPSGIYNVIAHEIGHSIDPTRCAFHGMKTGSGKNKLLEPLIGSSAPPLDCADWEKRTKQVLYTKAPVMGADPLQSVYDCLQPKDRLAPWGDEQIGKIAEQSADDTISGMAESNVFLRLAQPTRTLSDGKTVPNDLYRRPDRLVREKDNPNRPVNLQEIFNQELECVQLEKNGRVLRYKDAPLNERAALFSEALARTKKMSAALELEWYHYCGRNCGGEVQKAQLSKPADEDFADWIGNQAMDRRLARIRSLENRREASALAGALHCEQPGLFQHASDLAAAEGEFTYNVHSESRDRRIATYGKNVRSAVNCTLRQGESSRASCDR